MSSGGRVSMGLGVMMSAGGVGGAHFTFSNACYSSGVRFIN